jgi:hypothetical protein
MRRELAIWMAIALAAPSSVPTRHTVQVDVLDFL